MKDIPVLYCKLRKYERTSKKKSKDSNGQVTRRYMIPVKKDQIEGSNFEDIEDIVILSKENFDHKLQESQDIIFSTNELKQLLDSRDQEILQYKDLLKEKDQKIGDLKNLHEIQVRELQLKLNKMDDKYQAEVKAFNTKMSEFNDLIDQYDDLKTENMELEKEIKRLTDLRTLEKESFQIKLNEIELTNEEYNKLKKSHELLWDVVQEKDKIIKDLEKDGVVSNLLKKIRKKEGT